MKKISILTILMTMIVCALITMSVYADFDSFSADVTRLIENTFSDKYVSSITVKADDDKITVDGEERNVLDGRSAKTFKRNSSLMIPVRTLAQQDEAVLTYDEETETVIMSTEESTIEITNEQSTISVNDVVETLTESPTIIDGVMYVPLEDVAIAFGYEVSSDDDTAVLTKPFQTKRLIVKSKLEEIETFGATTVISGFNDLHVLQYETEEETKYAFERFSAMQGIEYVEIDKVVTTAEHKSWGTDYIGADTYNEFLVFDKSVGELPNVVVAVVDTGVDAGHDFLKDRMVSGWNFTTAVGTDTYDVNSHGTHVSGIIVDATLPNVKIMPVKVLNDKGSGTELSVYNGIVYATNQECDVINMSLGGKGKSLFYEEAISEAVSKNVIVVVAAGNESSDAKGHTPANVEAAITVGAIDSSGKIASFSNYGQMVDIWAPGVKINSSIPGNKFVEYNGTSMAAPAVASVAAMLKTYDKSLIQPQVDYILKAYATEKDINDPLNSGLLPVLDTRRLSDIDFTKVPIVQYSGGSGTLTNPYRISTVGQLAGLAEDVNRGNDYTGTYFKLTKSIDLAPLFGTGEGWTPIGFNKAFGGTFDGDSYKIENLYINSGDSSSGWGLFGNTAGATIKNLYVSISNNGINVNSNQVGGLIGNKINTKVINCHVTGGSITGSDMVGGLIGSNGSGDVDRCSSDTSVAGGNYVGGLIGQVNAGGSVSNAFAKGSVTGTGDYMGGLIGYSTDGDPDASGNKMTVTNAYTAGEVNGAGSGVGGLIGRISNVMTVKTSYWDKDVTTKSIGYGINDGTFSDDNKGYTTLDMKQTGSYTGFDFETVWNISDESNDGYPFIKREVNEPVAPTGLGISTLGTTEVTLTWDRMPNADSYDVYRGRNFIGNCIGNSYYDDSLLPDTVYTYRVVSRWRGFTSDAATIVVRSRDKLDAPKGVKYTLYPDKVYLSWEQVETAYGHYVYVNGDFYGSARYTATVENLTPDTEYTFGISAIDNKQVIYEPATVTVRTLRAVPPAPKGLKVTNITSTTMTVSWEPASDASNYRIEYNGMLASNVLATYYTLDRLTPDTNYTITVKAQSNSGTSDESSIIVRTIAAEQDATLSGLTARYAGQKADQFEFSASSGNTYYTFKVANKTTAIGFKPITLQAGATATVNGMPLESDGFSPLIGLNEGSNTIEIVVTAMDGVTTKVYTFVVTRQPTTLSTENTLSALIPSTGVLSPAFSSSVYSYTMTVPNSTSSISFIPTAVHSGATIVLTPSETDAINTKSIVESGTQSKPFILTVRSGASVDVIYVDVTAEDGATTRRYYIYVKRQGSDDATLSNIVPAYPGFYGDTYYMFEQEFSEENDTYTMTVPYSFDQIRFYTTKNNQDASVTVNGGSGNINLSVGKNTIPIVVTAQDGVTKKTYTVHVTRQSDNASNDASLVALMSLVGEYNTGFKSNTTRYFMGVPNDVSEIAFKPATAQDGATIKINGVDTGDREDSEKIALNVGDNIVSVVVTSQDKTVTKTYTVIVSRRGAQPSSDAALTALVPSINATSSSAALYPKFSSDITEYDIPVSQSVNFISFRHTPSNFFSTVRINGNIVKRGEESEDVPLEQLGYTIIPIVVTAEDGVTTRTYRIRVIKQPLPPLNACATDITPSSATITWDITGSEEVYDIYDGTSVVAMDIKSNVYTVNNLNSNTGYMLGVAAKNISGTSAKAIVEFKTPVSLSGPAVPTGLNVTNATTTSLQFNWSEPDGDVTGYEVSIDNWATKAVLNGDVTEHNFKGLLPNTEYTLHVRALNGKDVGDSATITDETVENGLGLPNKPTNLKVVSATATSLQIGWDKVIGATSYQTSYDNLTWTDCGRATEYNFVGLPIGVSTLYIRARSGGGISETAYITAPTVPAQVRPAPVISDITHESMRLTWTKVETATEYEIHRVSSTGYSELYKTVGDIDTIILDGLYSSFYYYEWFICAKNSSGVGEASDTSLAHAKVEDFYPHWVTGVSTSNITETEITVSWIKPFIVEKYNMYLYDPETEETVLVAENLPAETTSYTYTDLDPDTLYELIIYLEYYGTRMPSIALASTAAAGPFAVKGLVLSDITMSEITLTWDGVEGAEYYEVYEEGRDENNYFEMKFVAITTDNSFTFTELDRPGWSNICLGVVPVSAERKGSVAITESYLITYPPSVPIKLKADKITQNDVRLTWGESNSAVVWAYEVYYGIDSADTKYTELTKDMSWTSYPPNFCTVRDLEPGVTYKFAVVAKRPEDPSGKSLEVTATTLSPLPAPEGLKVSEIGQTQVTLKWNAVHEARNYEVSTDGSNWRDVGNVTKYTFTGFAPDSDYTMYVRAVNRGGIGQYSSITVTTLMNVPDVPAGLTVISVEDNHVTLSWDIADRADEYEVYYGIGAAYRKFVTSDPYATTCTVTGLLTGTEYKFAVLAKNQVGISRKCNEVSGTTTGLPQPPTGLAVTEASKTEITLTWKAVPGALGYESAITEVGVEPVQDDWKDAGTATSYEFSELTVNTEYDLHVRSVNGYGRSGAVYIMDGTLPESVPNAPTELATDVFERSARISWKPVRGATSYQVAIVSGFNPTDGNYSNVGNNTTYSTSSLALTSYTSYNVFVRAVNEYGYGEYTRVAIKTLPGSLDLLADPEVIDIARTQMTVEWGPATGATSYEVSLSTNNTNYWENIGDATSYTFTELTDDLGTKLNPNTNYTFRVRATGSTATPKSLSKYTLPEPPQGLAIGKATATTIPITWDNTVTGTGTYYVAVDNNQRRSLNGSLGSASLGSYEGVTSGTYHTIYLYTNNASGNSDALTASVWTLCVAPTNLNVVSGALSTSTATLSWDAVKGAASYQVQVYTSSIPSTEDDKWVDIGNVTSYTFTGLGANRNNYLHVRAVNPSGAGASAYKSAYTGPVAPTGLATSEITQTSIKLNWDAVSGANSYEAAIVKSGEMPKADDWISTGTTRTYTFNQLNVGTEYMLYVRAVSSSYGNGDAASVSVVTVGKKDFSVYSSYSITDLVVAADRVTFNITNLTASSQNPQVIIAKYGSKDGLTNARIQPITLAANEKEQFVTVSVEAGESVLLWDDFKNITPIILSSSL